MVASPRSLWCMDRLGDEALAGTQGSAGADVMSRCESAGRMSSSTEAPLTSRSSSEGGADYLMRESDLESTTSSSDKDAECRAPTCTSIWGQDADSATPRSRSPTAVIEPVRAVECPLEEPASKLPKPPCVPALKLPCVPVEGTGIGLSLDTFFEDIFHEVLECEDEGDYKPPSDIHSATHASVARQGSFQDDLDRARVEAGVECYDIGSPRGSTALSPDDGCTSQPSRWQRLFTRWLSRIGDTGFALASSVEYRALGRVGIETREEAIYHSLKRIIPAVLKTSFRVGELAWRDAAAELERRGGLQRVSWDVAREFSSAARKRLSTCGEDAVTNFRVRATRARRYVDGLAAARVQAIRARRFTPVRVSDQEVVEVQVAPRRALLREMGHIWYRYCQFVVHNAVLPVTKQCVQVLEYTFDVPAPEQSANEEGGSACAHGGDNVRVDAQANTSLVD